MLWSNIIIYLYCEFGEGVANGFNDIGIGIDQLDWYWLPHKMRRILLAVTIVAHKSFGFCKFGRESCAREIFKRVFGQFFAFDIDCTV